ncbi:MAG: LysM peptidoglycan-binding domain-containing protein [bacterium]|nr:LysM peptidoglycan-binding domain-containing protein [bacterium]
MSDRQRTATILLLVLAFLAGLGWLFIRRARNHNQGLAENQTARIAALEQNIKELRTVNSNLAEELSAERNRTKCGEVDCTGGRCYGVQRGDTLWDIAKRFYGNPMLYPSLAKVNNIENPDLLVAETCICLPQMINGNKLGAGERPRRAPVPMARHEAVPVLPPAVVTPEETPLAKAPEAVPQTEPEKEKPVEIVSVPEEPPAEIEARPEPEKSIPEPLPPEEKVAVIPSDIDTELPTILPGSAWNAAGNLSPIEKGNFLNYSYLEQGITIWRNGRWSLVPYLSLSSAFDNAGHDWNNKITGQAGIKVVRTFDHGIIQLGTGYAQEHRRISNTKNGQVFGSAGYWFGWDNPTRDPAGRRFFSAFPGSTWGIAGNISPAEKNNKLGMIYLQQGTTFTKIKGLSLIPFGEHSISFDSDGHDWNNRQIMGTGLKISAPIKAGGIVEIGAKYQRERRWQSGLSADGVTGFITFWHGWNPKIGGR